MGLLGFEPRFEASKAPVLPDYTIIPQAPTRNQTESHSLQGSDVIITP